MKTFLDIREAYVKKKLPNEKIVLNKKLMGVPVKISSYTERGRKQYCLYIDGDKLDSSIFDNP